jgi:Ca2+-binding EF-hand superfamily protein
VDRPLAARFARRLRAILVRAAPGSPLTLGLVAGAAPASAQTSPIRDVRTWVKHYDRNGDGKLDRGEFHQAAVDAFFLRDKDKNSYLAISELKEASPETIKAVKRKSDARNSLEEYVNALFKDFETADTDGDGHLTVEEIEAYRQKAR